MAASYQMLFELNAALGGGFASAFTQGSQQIENMKTKLDALNSAGNTADLMGGISTALQTAGVIKGLEEVYDTLKQCAEVSAQFETSMAGVKRTVGGSDDFISGLGESFKQLSTEIPITADELAAIATTAGQLGIAQADVQQFTTVMAQLGTTTDLSADSAATMLAQFANITGTKEYDRLGATVASLGDATATTASKVVEMSQGMAAAASQAGMSETDILAIAAAVGSLGIEAASGSTSMSTLISTLYKATETGNNLEEFASVAGMSAEQFKQSWGRDAVGTMNAFIQGLNDTERNGRSAVVILDELGIRNVRQTKAILGLASAGDLLSNTISQANTAWAQNTALGEKAGIMYNTTEAKMTMMQNSLSNLQIAVGDALNPAIASAAEAATGLIEPIAEFVEQNPAIVQGLTAMVGVLGVATAAVGAYTAATKLASAASLLFGGAIPGVGIILGASAAIGGLVFGVSALADAYDEAHPSFAELDAQFDSLNEKAKEQQAIIDLVDTYRALNQEADNLSQLMGNEFTKEIKFTGTVDGVDKLKPDDFIDGSTIQLTPEQAALLAANSFLDGSTIQLTPEQAAYLGANDFLNSTTVQLTAEQAEKLASSSFLTDTTVKLTPEQAKTLQSWQFLNSTKVQLTPEQKKLLKSAEFIDGTTTITLTAEQATKLSAAGFLDGTTVELTPEQANFLAAEGFLDGTEVQLTAEAANALAAEGYFTDGTVVSLTAEKANELQSSDFMADQEIELTGKAGNTLTAADFGLSDQTLIFLAEMDEPSYEAVAAKAKELSAQMAQANSDITAAQSTLATMQSDYSALEEKIAGTKNKKDKAALTEQLEELGTQIKDQETNVENLKGKYQELESGYTTAAAAAEELAGKKEHLAEVTQALRDASDGVVTATDQETEAFQREVDTLEALARARKNKYSAEALDTIKKQSRQYVEAVEAENEANAKAKQAAAHSDIVEGLISSGNAAEYVRGEFESLVEAAQSYEGTSWLRDDTEEAQALQKRFYGLQETINAITGEEYDFFGSGLAGMDATISGINFDILAMGESLGKASEAEIEFGEVAKANAQTQQDYIQNLVNGIVEGTLKEKELQAALEEAYSGYENGGEIIAGIMEKVKAGVEAARSAAEGSGDTAQTEAEKTVTAVNSIISQMDELKKAYDEAKEKAKAALNGRFGLFDDTGDPAQSKTTAEMQTNLGKQQTYWEQYNTALQGVLQNGVAKEIAAQLTDGSAESLATLQALASATPEEVEKINSAFEEVNAAKDTLASTIADMETQFTEGMENLKSKLEETVSELDKNSEAAAAAEATMAAYVASLDAGGAEATASAQATAAAVNSALESIQTEVTIHIGFEVDAVPNINIPGAGKGATVSKNAIGTDYATEGLHLVGEEGPEFVYLGGGEKVMTAHETANLLSSAAGGGETNISMSFPTSYNINGGNAEEIRRALEAHDRDLREQIEDVLQDLDTDRRRTSYR